MRIIEKQAWAVDALWIPNTLNYLGSLSYTVDEECDAEVEMILSRETVDRNPFDVCINERKNIIEKQKKFKEVWEEINALAAALNEEPDVSGKSEKNPFDACLNEQKNIIEHPKKFKYVWEEINALAEVLYKEPGVSKEGESASQDTHGQITVELTNAINEDSEKKMKRKQSFPRRLLDRIKKIFSRKKIR